ncbi:MAG: universal stress protein [Kiloniellales bacterium]|nr:universal stress protein [Kiloniellales bacterium]MDJ0982843.1 universal stress protein [Kiloniellales bacterium]
MQNIVVLVDLDEESSWRRALPRAIDYANHAGARLHVLTIVPDEMFKMTVVAQLIPEDYEDKLVEDAKQRLAKIVEQQGAGDLELEPAVRLGSVYKEALRFARDVDAELIVMGAHKPELKDYLLGSNASQIVRHAACSVWVVRG